MGAFKENLDALKNLIQHDIISNINESLRVGNIALEDAATYLHAKQYSILESKMSINATWEKGYEGY